MDAPLADPDQGWKNPRFFKKKFFLGFRFLRFLKFKKAFNVF